ncbi:hypothetical protein WJX73_004712 [Symbiochloris irregularis]|uniref:Ubiquitin carboxyl-terminal hydrolase n=1 Tax=Symbiochloris irregularis TaxID=706552 RepID=A0AAW1NS16_9CHLO
MADSEGAWTTIESDPGVFTELISRMGATGVQVEELYALDEQALDELRPVYGLIFLFKWQNEPPDVAKAVFSADPEIYFAQQVVPNACATQAILSVLFNRPEISLGADLSDLKAFSLDLPPDVRGMTIGSAEGVRQAHNSFASPNPFLSDEKLAAGEKDDAYHFIAYVPVNGQLYELDGLKPGPVSLASCTQDDWTRHVCPHIRERIARYSQSEIRFNLLAIVRDRAEALQEQLQALDAASAGAGSSHESAGAGADAMREAGSSDEASNLQAARMELEAKLAQEQEKHQLWRDENVRRRHNYMPFLFTYLNLLAKQGQLRPLMEQAEAAAKEKLQSSQKAQQ